MKKLLPAIVMTAAVFGLIGCSAKKTPTPSYETVTNYEVTSKAKQHGGKFGKFGKLGVENSSKDTAK